MGLTLVAGAPQRPQQARTAKAPAFQPVLLATLDSAYTSGRHAHRLALAIRRDLDPVRHRIERLSANLERPELRDHPKRAAAAERMLALCRWAVEEEGRAHELTERAALKRGQMVSVWSRLTPEAAATVEEAWAVRARTPQEFLAWVDRAWAADADGVEGLECPF